MPAQFYISEQPIIQLGNDRWLQYFMEPQTDTWTVHYIKLPTKWTKNTHLHLHKSDTISGSLLIHYAIAFFSVCVLKMLFLFSTGIISTDLLFVKCNRIVTNFANLVIKFTGNNWCLNIIFCHYSVWHRVHTCRCTNRHC